MGTLSGIELKQLVCNSQFEPRWELYELADLGPKEVRVKSELTAAKHGTEHSELLGKSIYSKVPYLEDKKVFDRSQEQEHDPSQWRGVGNTTVGRVIEVGSEVTDLKEGDQVWGYGNFRTVHQGGHFQLMPDGFSPEAACCMDPANFALAAVRDGNIRVGEKVIVFGMGAIGLFTVQLARFSGAIDVVAVDPLPNRRKLALKHGATMAVDPNEVGDFGMASREWLGDGADVTVEASGNYHALNQAIRATRYAGNVVLLAFYTGESQGLFLGEEFHFNQTNIISARACSHPQRDLYWSEGRIFEILIQLFRQGDLIPHGLPSPIVNPDELTAAYGQILHHPAEVIKVGVRW
ncbi:alcohol dehydrogenase [Candidatus Poribacteria bacterium]|nr:alcohol dehydrogenase [Candidatus Poribacteria bacterium]